MSEIQGPRQDLIERNNSAALAEEMVARELERGAMDRLVKSHHGLSAQLAAAVAQVEQLRAALEDRQGFIHAHLHDFKVAWRECPRLVCADARDVLAGQPAAGAALCAWCDQTWYAQDLEPIAGLDGLFCSACRRRTEQCSHAADVAKRCPRCSLPMKEHE